MATSQHPTTIDNLPDEILSDIFIRLLAKQLAQMRCVCKPWNAFLSESSFIKSHLHHSTHNKDRTLLFVQRGLNLFSFAGISITARPAHSPDLELNDFVKLPDNPQSKLSIGLVIGCVNGLICFFYKSCELGDNHYFLIYIWNPSLNAMLSLPPCSFPDDKSTYYHFRFGFDPKTNDYKVVKLTSVRFPPNVLPQVEVYSMRKGSWDLITDTFPSRITMVREYDNVSVDGHNGHLHWFGSTCADYITFKPETIVEFDLGAETFCEIPLPDCMLDYSVRQLNVLGVLSGKLCVISRFEDGECEVWVMGAYGVAESWVRRYVFPQFGGNSVPYGFTSRDELLFAASEHRFASYDPVAAKAKTFEIMYAFCVDRVVEYVESLVWVTPGVS